MGLYDRIMQCCSEQNLLPSELSDKIGLARSVIYEVRKRDSMSTKSLAMIAKGLNVSCDYLITGEEFNNQLSHFDRTLVDAYHAADDATQQNISFMLRRYGISMPSSEDAPSSSSKTG